MFSAVGALYGTQLLLQDLRLSNVASVLSTHEAWIDIRRGTISSLGRWRRRHTFLPNPAISWKVAFDFFRRTVGTTHSDILSEAGHRLPLFSADVLKKCALLAMHVMAKEGRDGDGFQVPGLGKEWKVGKSPMWESEDASSTASREGNVCNDALHVVGLRGRQCLSFPAGLGVGKGGTELPHGPAHAVPGNE